MRYLELKDSGYSLFTDPDTRDSFIAEMTYLEQLAVDHNVDIDGWDIDEFLEEDDGNENSTEDENGEAWTARRPHSREGLTRTFLNRVGELTASTKPFTPKELTQLEEKSLREAQVLYAHSSTRDLERYIRGKHGAIKDHLDSIRTNQRDLVTFGTELKARKEGKLPEATYGDHLKKITASGFYRYHHHTETACFYETQPVIIQEVNRKAKLEIRVSLGTFLVEQSFKTSLLRVHPLKDNIYLKKETTIHPHVQPPSGICWGSAHNQAQALFVLRDFSGVMALFEVLLQSYGVNPFVSIQDFQKARALQQDKKLKEKTGIIIARPEEEPAASEDLSGIVIYNLAGISNPGRGMEVRISGRGPQAQPPEAVPREDFIRSSHSDALWPDMALQQWLIRSIEGLNVNHLADFYSNLQRMGFDERRLEAIAEFLAVFAGSGQVLVPVPTPQDERWGFSSGSVDLLTHPAMQPHQAENQTPPPTGQAPWQASSAIFFPDAAIAARRGISDAIDWTLPDTGMLVFGEDDDA